MIPNKKAKPNETPIPMPSPPTIDTGGTPAPLEGHSASQSPLAFTEPFTPSEPTVSSQVQPESWANLNGLLDTLKRATAVSGLGPVKGIIEGLVELIGLYEDAGQGQTEFDNLRVQLESIFDELNQHLSSSPAVTASMDNICWSIRKELELIKAQQARPKKRKLEDAENDARMVLECYRRIQEHLQRLTRNANISTWKIVDLLAAENRLQKLASSLWECYNSKKANELKRGACTGGTRMSVLAQMYEWATSPNAGNIFWMSGMAGTGKTTIAYSLCEQLDAKENRLLCANFFCSRSLPECRDVGRIIPSIAYQLARCSQPFRYALSKATEQDPDAHTRLPRMQFNSLILQPFSDINVREAFPMDMVVVIDALDECEDVKSTKQILDVLLTESKNLPVRFVVSSRPEPAIRDQMEKNGTWVDARVVLHELDSGEVKTDIRTYLKAELDPIKLPELEIEKLVARAGVLFIYAATVVRYVGYDDFGWDPRSRLDIVLGAPNEDEEALTSDIDDLYATILRAAFDNPMLRKKERDNMKLILGTVICARQPLTADTLNYLLNLGGVARVQAALRPLWSVLHVMGSNMTVTTLHASFPDYLLDPERSGVWCCDAGTHHYLLARRCFECIRDSKPQFNVCQLESSYLLDDEVPDMETRVQLCISTELRYACQYWPSHLDTADSATASELVPLLLRFLMTHLLLWMEVRNLTKIASKIPGELTAVQRWAIKHGMTRDAINLLSDAWRFASTFVSSPISNSTPHLYISMLPLLLSPSPIRAHYSGRFRRMIGVEGTALGQRNDALLAQWKLKLEVSCMTCSPDGTYLAIGGGASRYGNNNRLYLLDAASGNLLLDLSQNDKADVSSIAFSPDSLSLVSGRKDGIISSWDITNARPVLGPFKAHDGIILSIKFSHDGSYIASASGNPPTYSSPFVPYSPSTSSPNDHPIRIWDALSGTPSLHPLIGHTSYVTCISIFSNDLRLVSGSHDRTIRIWDMQSGNLVLDPLARHDREITDIALSTDDSHIISGSGDGTIRVWNSQTGQMVLGPLKDQDGYVQSLSISPDSSAITSTSKFDSIRIWDAASGKILSQLGPFSQDTCSQGRVAYSVEANRIFFSDSKGNIRLLDAKSTATTSELLPGHTKGINSIDVSSNGRYVVSGSLDETLCTWDVTQGTLLLGPLRGHSGSVSTVRFSTDGSNIVSCSHDRTVRQWDAQSGASDIILRNIQATNGAVSATYSPDGTRIVVFIGTGELRIIRRSNPQSGRVHITAPSNSYGLHADFSPDGASVIAGYRDGSISAWDAQTGQKLFSREGNRRSQVSSLVFSPDGLYCAQSNWDGTIVLRNIHTGEQIPEAFEGHIRYTESMRFSPDSARLVSGSEDRAVHVWDIEYGKSWLGPLRGHTNTVTSVAPSPNGKSIISASHDLAIRVWDVQPKALPSKFKLPDTWVLDKDGWVVSGESRRLFWVPSDLHTSLMWPRNTILISCGGYMRLNFEDALIGEAWANCYCNS